MGYVNYIVDKYTNSFYDYYRNFNFQKPRKNRFNIWNCLEKNEKDRLENLFETCIIKKWPERYRAAFENSRILPFENYLKEKGFTADSSIGINLLDSYSTSGLKNIYHSQHNLTKITQTKLQKDLIVLTDKLIHVELHNKCRELQSEFQSHFMSQKEKDQFIEYEYKKKKDEENKCLKMKKIGAINNTIRSGIEHLKAIKTVKEEFENFLARPEGVEPPTF